MNLFKIFAISCLTIFLSCGEQKSKLPNDVAKSLKTEEVSYVLNGKKYQSFVAFSEDSMMKKPVVMVIPEWWGLTDYAKNRAKQLAELGYFAIAVDFYGDGKVVDNPDDAQKLAQPFYENPDASKAVFDAAKAQISKFKRADPSKIAVIGYCFGGAQALNMARQDKELKGAVSFHGNLITGVKPDNNAVPMLICNGADDSFVAAKEIAEFKKEMDSAKIKYTFINYPNAVHSFTNPASTEAGKKFNMKIAYNKAADEKSWNDMKVFFKEIFK